MTLTRVESESFGKNVTRVESSHWLESRHHWFSAVHLPYIDPLETMNMSFYSPKLKFQLLCSQKWTLFQKKKAFASSINAETVVFGNLPLDNCHLILRQSPTMPPGQLPARTTRFPQSIWAVNSVYASWLGITMPRYCCFNIVEQKWVATLLLLPCY